jgi:hypothetical protein
MLASRISTDRFLDDVERNDEPLAGLDRLAEAVLDRETPLRAAEESVEQRLQPRAAQVVRFGFRDDFDGREQIVGVIPGVGAARLELVAGHADLVDQRAVLRKERMRGQAAQHLDRAGLDSVPLPWGALGRASGCRLRVSDSRPLAATLPLNGLPS